MQTLLRTLLPLTFAGALFAQFPGLTLPPSGNNQRASVIQYIGPVQVTIEYSSPAVHAGNGQDRRSQIWGKLVPYGMSDLGLNGGKLSPWRAGANENTVFAISDPVTIEGQALAAGRYGLHMIPGQDEWTIIFSKNAHAWGSFFYDESDDALRVKVNPTKHEYREYLTYEFSGRKPAETTAALQWEELSVPWTIKVDDIKEIYTSRLRRELTAEVAFDYRAYDAAAQYLANANVHLEEALKWADKAISMPFIGQANFDTLSTKALVLSKMGRGQEAMTIMQGAIKLPGTTALQIHGYGRTLQQLKQNQAALEVFKYNFERNGDAWPVHVGLMRGYAGIGDLPQALEHARKAVAQAPDAANKNNLENMVKLLSEGKNIPN
ncbi:MAG TPA: DUF2911 domain-containing protein [Bryobacteraceae bacterium]|nr:DUF2911 domain-containing protein [Bryobacteraceae bacterium]